MQRALTEISEKTGACALNDVVLTGYLVERSAIRYTPGGVPVLEGRLSHRSEQTEAGSLRQVDFEIVFIALAENAHRLSASVGPVRVKGFLAAKSLKAKQIVLHITDIEFIEGIE